jgi:hypothetical protein
MDLEIECTCGKIAFWRMVSKVGKDIGRIVVVHNVPIYRCTCGQETLELSDALQLGKRIRQGLESKVPNINFWGD